MAITAATSACAGMINKKSRVVRDFCGGYALEFAQMVTERRAMEEAIKN